MCFLIITKSSQAISIVNLLKTTNASGTIFVPIIRAMMSLYHHVMAISRVSSLKIINVSGTIFVPIIREMITL
jgi:hypothetical protein